MGKAFKASPHQLGAMLCVLCAVRTSDCHNPERDTQEIARLGLVWSCVLAV